MNTLELITKAYYLSGILARGFETISAEQTSDGLDLLNDILAEKSMSTALIPYYSHTTFNAVPGQEVYTIPGLMDIRELTFNINDVRFPMVRDTQKRYFGAGRVDNLENLPFHYYAERQVGSMLIYLYFVPNEAYEMKITGKYSLQELALFDDLDPILDRFYTSYLKYHLAKRICDFYGNSYPPQLEPTYKGLEAQLSKMVGIDLSITRDSMFRRNYFGYGDANLGRGWSP
jgi:hypothetical protein